MNSQPDCSYIAPFLASASYSILSMQRRRMQAYRLLFLLVAHAWRQAFSTLYALLSCCVFSKHSSLIWCLRDPRLATDNVFLDNKIFEILKSEKVSFIDFEHESLKDHLKLPF